MIFTKNGVPAKEEVVLVRTTKVRFFALHARDVTISALG
jgi:hypothetical protein